MTIKFDLLEQDQGARRGRLHTAHGTAETPAFMAVGTAGTVKGMTADGVRETGSEIILGNTYHLMLRPSAERIAHLGGLRRMKRMVDDGLEQPLDTALRYELAINANHAESYDRQEGLAAFAEKRQPEFKGS